MSIYFAEPAPTLTINDETGEWVMTHNVTRVVGAVKGSWVYVRQDVSSSGIAVHCRIASPLSPEELRQRLFQLNDNVREVNHNETEPLL